LEDFFRQLGVLLQLPPRSLKDAAKPLAAIQAAANRVKAPLTKWVLPIAASLMLVGYGATRIQPPPAIVVPQTMLGTWTTQQGAYKGKSFALTGETIVLNMGGNGRDVVHKLLSFSAADRRDTTIVKLTYDADGKPLPMGFSYTTGGGRPAIVLDHPWDIVWHRADSDSTMRIASAPQSPP
jgi:hypothetical protein